MASVPEQAAESPVSRFPVVDPEHLPGDVPDDVAARLAEVAEKAGFVPNVFRALAHRPEEFRAFFAYHDALMERESGLTKAEREMVVVATSAANHCTYCVVAHGAILRIRAKDPHLADYLATSPRLADLTARQHAMLDFALRIARAPETVEDAHLDALREHGFGDADIWDIGAIASFFAMSNRLAHLMALRPNPEFHLMGRLPRDS